MYNVLQTKTQNAGGVFANVSHTNATTNNAFK